MGIKQVQERNARTIRGFLPCPMPDARCPMPDARCPMPDARCPIPHFP
ncbi:MAG: hypothetical protein KME31_25065 [Tolypothrix carrinoi HA7290-LM1]|nr:hypothetical protein [Tolypothrix carrinoi HA7290-LM1]